LLELALFLPFRCAFHLALPAHVCLIRPDRHVAAGWGTFWEEHPAVSYPCRHTRCVRRTGQTAGSCLLASFRLDGSGRDRDFSSFSVMYLTLYSYLGVHIKTNSSSPGNCPSIGGQQPAPSSGPSIHFCPQSLEQAQRRKDCLAQGTSYLSAHLGSVFGTASINLIFLPSALQHTARYTPCRTVCRQTSRCVLLPA
jgi:hypothetical protein